MHVFCKVESNQTFGGNITTISEHEMMDQYTELFMCNYLMTLTLWTPSDVVIIKKCSPLKHDQDWGP